MGSDGGAMGGPGDQLRRHVRPAKNRRRPDRLSGFSAKTSTPTRCSQQKAAEAWSGGYFAKSVVPVRDQNVLISIAANTCGRTPPSLAETGLRGLALGGFRRQRCKCHWWKRSTTYTGGNSSGIVDGAALVMIGSAAAGKSCRA